MLGINWNLPCWALIGIYRLCWALIRIVGLDMPVLKEKWVTAPLTVIKELFERAEGPGSDGSWGIKEFFERKLGTADGLASVPSLHSHSLNLLHDGCLVRYTAMIQDQFDPQLYLKVYHVLSNNNNDQVRCCGLYSDNIHLTEGSEVDWNHPSNVMGDMHTLYCVPIPAETWWVTDITSVDSDISPRSVEVTDLKRKHEEESKDMMAPMEVEVSSDIEGANGNISEGFQSKKKCSVPTADRPSSEGYALNFPLPGEKGLPCLVKLYRECEELKVGSVVEVVGVLSVDPSIAPLAYDMNYDPQQVLDAAAEKKVHYPPPSLVPRLHAITVRLLPHSNPLLPYTLTFPLHPHSIERFLSAEVDSSPVDTYRALLLDMLTQVLAGDSLAAEYTLLHLLSSVYGRMEVTALGKYSLNLSQWSGEASSQALYQLLTSLLTKCFLLPLTLEHMNVWRFVPKKDYTSNRILSAVLQLSPGTELLVDETVLAEGHLTPGGVANLTALGNVVQTQRLKYDFQFHSTEFDCDLPVLILSEGKSILKVDCHVPLLATTPVKPLPPPSNEVTNKCRQYFTLCRGLDYSLTPQIQSSVEEDLVRLRQSDPQMSEQHFLHLLCTARLLALSHGCSTLTPKLWTHTLEIEKQRTDRIKTMS